MKLGLGSLGVVLTGALVLTAAGPATAEEALGPQEDALRQALSAQQSTPASSIAPTLSAELERDGVAVSAPALGREQLTVALPGNAGDGEAKGDLALDVTEGDEFSTAVQATGSGTFRALLHIESASAPTEYVFEVGDNAELIPLEDGGVSVRNREGDLIGLFEPAWAVDAAGESVATHYEVRGSTLVQHVALTPTMAYPVVADPFWIPALLVMARISAHAASRAAARGVSQAMIKQVVQNGKKTAGNKGTSVFTSGSGKNKIRVIVDNKTGNVITVTKG